MIEVLSPVALWDLIKNASRWLVNLRRANHTRQRESVNALRKVVIAARKTAVYMRQLDDLKVTTLAKRCLINGKQWADPKSMNPDFLQKADAGFERIEQLANQLLAQLKP